MINTFVFKRKTSLIVLLSALLLLGMMSCGDDADPVEETSVEDGPDAGDHDTPDVGDNNSGDELAAVYEFSSDDLHPEGGDYDPVTRAFYVGSLTQGNVVRMDADGTESVFYEGNGDDLRMTLGMKIDIERRRLWVCSMLNDGVEPGTIWVFDLDAATRTHEFVLEDTFEGASCNDVDIDAQGRAYITDRKNPHIYRIDLAGETVEIWAVDDLLKPELIGLNGVVVTPDQQALLVNKYNPPRLFRISLADPSDVTEITFEGDNFRGRGLISGADGIAMLGDVLYVAFSDMVMQLTFEQGWSHARVSSLDLDTGLATVIVAEGDIYVLKGEIVEFVLNRPLDLPFRLMRVNLDLFL